jgi:Fur family ferric uptake transcriptional regulator
MTKQGEAILAYLRCHAGEHLTAAQIAQHLSQSQAQVGRTTVYRQLNKLVRAGAVRRYLVDPNGSACYQFIEDGACPAPHLHLKCEGCGELIHTGESESLRLIDGIFRDYGYTVDAGRTLIYGICGNCAVASN